MASSAKYDGEVAACDGALSRLCLRIGVKHAPAGTPPPVESFFIERIRVGRGFKYRIARAREEGGGHFTNDHPFSSDIREIGEFTDYIIDLGTVAMMAFDNGKKVVHDHVAKRGEVAT